MKVRWFCTSLYREMNNPMVTSLLSFLLAGSWTPLHADVFRSYSWSANVCGKKRWFFLDPSQYHLVFDRYECICQIGIHDIFFWVKVGHCGLKINLVRSINTYSFFKLTMDYVLLLMSTLTKLSIDDIPSYLPFSFFGSSSLHIFLSVFLRDGSALMCCLFA